MHTRYLALGVCFVLGLYKLYTDWYILKAANKTEDFVETHLRKMPAIIRLSLPYKQYLCTLTDTRYICRIRFTRANKVGELGSSRGPKDCANFLRSVHQQAGTRPKSSSTTTVATAAQCKTIDRLGTRGGKKRLATRSREKNKASRMLATSDSSCDRGGAFPTSDR